MGIEPCSDFMIRDDVAHGMLHRGRYFVLLYEIIKTMKLAAASSGV